MNVNFGTDHYMDDRLRIQLSKQFYSIDYFQIYVTLIGDTVV